MGHAVVMSVHVFLAVAIIALVLLQRGKGADAGAGFGAGASGTVFGAILGTITDRTSASRGNQAGRPSRGTEPTADRASARTWFTARLDHPACVIHARGWMTLT